MALRLSRRPNRVRLRGRAKAICPISKTIDEYVIEVEYLPRGLALQIEKFVELLNSYRDREILHEEVAVDLAERIRELIQPVYVKVVAKSEYLGVEVEATAELGAQPPLYI